jgi:hypothetical protein
MLYPACRLVVTRVGLLFGLAVLLVGAPGTAASQTAAPKPPARTRPPAKPAAPKAPAVKPPTVKAPPAATVAAPPAVPPPVAAPDLRFTTTYTASGLKTESVTYTKGQRERFEFADMVLIKQPDQHRTLQISRAANSYLVIPDGGLALATMQLPTGATPAAPGVVTVTTTIVDTGERKQAFGREARHIKTVMDKQPLPGACDQSTQHIETDGWYIDLPATVVPSGASNVAPPPTGLECADEIKATQTGDPKALGFPIAYAMTMNGSDGTPNLVSMEISQLETTTLDAALFEIPAGFTAAGDIRALARALSDSDERKLAVAVPEAVVATRIPGAVRVGVPELTNSSGQAVDTRALRTRLIAELSAAHVQGEPLAAGSQAELLQIAVDRGYAYLVVADVTELKVAKGGGGFGGALRAASRAASAVTAASGAPKDPTEATLDVKLVQPDGKTRLSSTKKGKDGGGLDMKTGMGLARMAGSMYVGVLTGRTMFGALNSMTNGNLGGMGMLGNPALINLQSRGLGGGALGGFGRGMDPTAGAASFLMQQAMASDIPVPGASGQIAPSFDAALGDALVDAAKAVSESVKKADDAKKK